MADPSQWDWLVALLARITAIVLIVVEAIRPISQVSEARLGAYLTILLGPTVVRSFRGDRGPK